MNHNIILFVLEINTKNVGSLGLSHCGIDSNVPFKVGLF